MTFFSCKFQFLFNVLFFEKNRLLIFFLCVAFVFPRMVFLPNSKKVAYTPSL